MFLFGSLTGDVEEDPIFGQHMRSMRQMSSMMNSMFGDPFSAMDQMNALTGGFPNNHQRPHSFNGGLTPFGFPPMMNMNRPMSGNGIDGASFSSSSVVSMSHGPDGRPQIYQATSSTKTGPGGLRETQKTVQDSRTGVKKMAIGHHIGERAHIIEREQNLRSGQHEERQDFINLEEDEAPQFDREFSQRSRQGMRIQNAITDVSGNGSRRQPQAIMPAQPTPSSESGANSAATNPNDESQQPNVELPPSPPPSSSPATYMRRGYRQEKMNRLPKNATTNLPTSRRPLRTPISSPLAMSSGLNMPMSRSSSIHPHPYNASPRRSHHQQRGMKGHTAQAIQPQHHVEIEELPDDYDEGAASYNPQQK